MNSHCYNSQQIIDYLDGQLPQKERRDISIHITECEMCSKKLERLNKIDQHLSLKCQKDTAIESTKMIDQHCVNDIELYNYLEGRLANEDARAIELHLNSCYTCFENFASLLRNTQSQASVEEAKEIAAVRNISMDEQVTKIVSIIDTECAQKPGQISGAIMPLKKWRKKLKSFFENSMVAKKEWRWALASVCILLLAGLIGFPRYMDRRGTGAANNAINSMTQLHFISDTDSPRPIGGFRFIAFGATRSPNELDKIKPAKQALLDALKFNPDNSLINEYLGTYYLLIEKDIEQASRYYQIAYRLDSTRAAILNDMGVLAIAQKNYESAIRYLLEAQQRQPGLHEAQYNLIIAYSGIGKIAEASQAREQYKALDPTISWYEVSKSLIDSSAAK